MLNPFINLLSNIISLVNLVLIAWLILSMLLNFDIINRNSPIIMRIYSTLEHLVNPLLNWIRRPVRKYLPDFGGIDISPIILLLLLHFLDNAIYSWFYSI